MLVKKECGKTRDSACADKKGRAEARHSAHAGSDKARESAGKRGTAHVLIKMGRRKTAHGTAHVPTKMRRGNINPFGVLKI